MDTMKKEPTCKDLVKPHFRSRLNDLKAMWETYQEDPEAYTDDEDRLDEYGLSFDYVPEGTYDDLPDPYFRYQLSWGGPSDEFRIFARRINGHWALTEVQYWFLDWFDGAYVTVLGADWEWFVDFFLSYFGESLDHVYEQAMGDQP